MYARKNFNSPAVNNAIGQCDGYATVASAPSSPRTMAGGIGLLEQVIFRARDIAVMIEDGVSKYAGNAPRPDSSKTGSEIAPNGAVDAIHQAIPFLNEMLSRIEAAGHRLHQAHD